MAFDPYHKWLGIPPEEQPASHYRLLAIEEFESDADVIETAAEQRTLLLRTFQTGPEAELAERLLNDVARRILFSYLRYSTYFARSLFVAAASSGWKSLAVIVLWYLVIRERTAHPLYSGTSPFRGQKWDKVPAFQNPGFATVRTSNLAIEAVGMADFPLVRTFPRQVFYDFHTRRTT